MYICTDGFVTPTCRPRCPTPVMMVLMKPSVSGCMCMLVVALPVQMYRWLGYANLPASLPDCAGKPQPVDEQADFFSKREFSFTIEDDVYIR